MLIPPFCPYEDCRYHTALPIKGRWYHIAGSYTTKVRGTVKRFRCTGCGRTFSEQTFRLDYYVKRQLSYQQVLTYLCNCGGLRATARILGVNHQTISNRIGRIARQAMAVQAELLACFQLQEPLVTDGFESFVADQYQPNNIHLLTGKRSQFLFAYDYAHLRRKGRMSDHQKAERQRREERYLRPRRTIPQSFRQIVAVIEQFALRNTEQSIRVYSDEKREYQTVIKHSEVLQRQARRGKFTHLTVSSQLPRTVHNPLFAVNYYDRELRKDNADQVRETVRFSRSVNNALERMAMYQLYHNFFKPYRVAHKELKRVSHAEMAGFAKERIEEALEGIFSRRRFFTHVRLSWSQLLVWMRMVGNLDRFDGGYWPKYVWM